MKEKIRVILNRIESGNLAFHDAEIELLNLFAVSGRSELLRDYFKWHKEQGYVSHKDSDIDEFLASNCR
jgi:hypothetical protein